MDTETLSFRQSPVIGRCHIPVVTTPGREDGRCHGDGEAADQGRVAELDAQRRGTCRAGKVA